MAWCGMTAPHFTTIAHFVSSLRDDIAQIFAAVLAVCDGQGLIGREMFAIDGVKLPSNAFKHRSGTRAEFTQRAEPGFLTSVRVCGLRRVRMRWCSGIVENAECFDLRRDRIGRVRGRGAPPWRDFRQGWR